MAVSTTTTNYCRCLMLKLAAFLLISSLNSYTTTAVGLGSNSTKKGAGIESEMLSLLALKEGIFKPPTSWLSSWRAGTNCCSWQGVGCDHTTGHVIKLNLRYPYVEFFPRGGGYRYYDDRVPGPSKLNSSLLGLVHLRHLDLSLNNFSTQPIPKFIGSLVKLEYLNLSLAGFSGTIPLHLGNLSALRFLDLNSNSYYFDGSVLLVDEGGLDWVSRVTSLVYLDMSFVDLFNAGDSWIRNINMLPSLSVLLLSDAQLEKIPSSLPQANFTSLTMLDLSYNHFHSTIPNWLFDITTLLQVDLHDCEFSGRLQISERTHGRLQFLNLLGNNITGDIQEFLESFTDLVYLDLTENRITGELPRNIGKLSKMEFLGLKDNNIEGNIPETMGSLCKLSFLDLSGNMIGGQITGFVEELSRCVEGSNLQSVNLAGNRLNGTIPAIFGHLRNLQVLDLSNNFFVGNITEVHFSNLSNLDFLSIAYNNLEMIFNLTWIPSFNASSIDMCSCHMGPRFPAWLRTQTSLESLCISEAGILENIPHWFWDIDITDLNVSHNQINGQLPPSLETRKYSSLDLSSNSFDGKIPSFDPTVLGYINLSNNSFSGSIPLSLANGNYYFFSLSSNHLTGSIPPFYFNNSQSLQVLDLSNNNFDGRLPLLSANNSYLIVIDLSSNNFSGNIPDSIGSLTSLQSLHLRNNSLLGSIPRFLQHCKQLVILDIGENRFSGTIPSWIGESLFSLRVLRLRSNSFSGNIPSQISLLTNLQILCLASNNLSGILPPSFWNFKAMIQTLKVEKSMLSNSFYRENILITAKGIDIVYTTVVLSLVVGIDLSNNGFCGEIHEELTELHGLQLLNLSNNHFTGKIPENIGSMGQLESLDLSINNFSGNIPPSISNLNFLERLNLSHNNLSGRIPLGEQIQSLNDPSIYGDNLDLCGWSIPECPVDKPAEPSIGGGGGDVQGDDTDKIWLYTISVVGFIMGFWSFIGTLMIKVSWRISFFHIIDRLYDWIYVKLAINIARIKSYGEL